MDDFDWLPSECADERYPMQLLAGELWVSEDDNVGVPAGKIVNNGWGEVGSRRLIGEPLKPVPERLTLAWFSYTEDQCFGGGLELPKLELTELFRAGFKDPVTGEPVSWSTIIVGMGLGGWTSVWLEGGGVVREVASATLEPVEIEWGYVLNNPDISRSNFVGSKLRSRLSDVAFRAHTEHGPPVSTWPKYARRDYQWRLVVEGVKVPLHMSLRSFNGERSIYDFAREPPPQLLHTVPKHMEITWLSSDRKRILTKIGLDEREVFEAFDKACVPASDRLTPRLRVELGPRGRMAISVESDDATIPLTRSRVELLSLVGS